MGWSEYWVLDATNDDAGINTSETLRVNGPSGLVATIVMAPHRSHKKLTIVRNPAGGVIAGCFTAEESRPRSGSSSYYVLGTVPRTRGQAGHMRAPGGNSLYHWATVTS